MATNYKVRLRRFNGIDYDTLKFSSSDIIMNNGSTLQNIIPSTNGIMKNNNGNFQIAQLGTDYGSLTFTITLLASGWSNNVQTISDQKFISSGYVYSVSPNPDDGSFIPYGESQIYANNVTTNGQMVFNCVDVPSSNLTVVIKREVSASA